MPCVCDESIPCTDLPFVLDAALTPRTPLPPRTFPLQVLEGAKKTVSNERLYLTPRDTPRARSLQWGIEWCLRLCFTCCRFRKLFCMEGLESFLDITKYKDANYAEIRLKDLHDTTYI